TGKNWFWMAPLVNDGVVYAGALDGTFYAIDPDRLLTDQRPLWSFKAESAIRSRPAIIGNTVVVADRDGDVYGLDVKTGNVIWTKSLGAPILADLSTQDNEVYISLQDGKLKTVEATNGNTTEF